jgi:hypothetical protein
MRWLLPVLLAGFAACGDNMRPQDQPDATRIDAGVDAAIDAPVAVSPGPCLDRPTDLPMPPSGALPCDLLPPGFAAP